MVHKKKTHTILCEYTAACVNCIAFIRVTQTKEKIFAASDQIILKTVDREMVGSSRARSVSGRVLGKQDTRRRQYECRNDNISMYVLIIFFRNEFECGRKRRVDCPCTCYNFFNILLLTTLLLCCILVDLKKKYTNTNNCTYV